jgi:hypothetical protein
MKPKLTHPWRKPRPSALEKKRAANRKWCSAHPEQNRERVRRWKLANRERVKANERRSYLRHSMSNIIVKTVDKIASIIDFLLLAERDGTISEKDRAALERLRILVKARSTGENINE